MKPKKRIQNKARKEKKPKEKSKQIEVEKLNIKKEFGIEKAKPIDDSAQVEINNLKEEIKGILEPCIKCGMCKSLCPVFKVLLEEYYSPRGKAILLSEDIYDKIVFHCTLCKACEKKCPLNIKVCEAIKKSREVLNLQGKELEGNKEMMQNIRETGNPFGKEENPDKLYCC